MLDSQVDMSYSFQFSVPAHRAMLASLLQAEHGETVQLCSKVRNGRYGVTLYMLSELSQEGFLLPTPSALLAFYSPLLKTLLVPDRPGPAAISVDTSSGALAALVSVLRTGVARAASDQQLREVSRAASMLGIPLSDLQLTGERRQPGSKANQTTVTAKMTFRPEDERKEKGGSSKASEPKKRRVNKKEIPTKPLKEEAQEVKLPEVTETQNVFLPTETPANQETFLSRKDEISQWTDCTDIAQPAKEFEDPIADSPATADSSVKTKAKPSSEPIKPFKITEMTAVDGKLKESVRRVSKIYDCKDCPKKFSAQTFLDLHISNKHGEKSTFSCEFCERKFTRNEQLRYHTRTHTKPYKCDECDTGFATTQQLKKHKVRIKQS